MKKRLTALLAALILCCAALPGCSENTAETGGAEPVNEAAAVTAAEEEIPAEAEEERLYADVPESADYGGDEIYFLVWRVFEWGDSPTEYHDIYAEEYNGEGINDAVYSRNVLVEDRFKVKITQEVMQHNQIDSAVSKSVQSGDTTYDVVYPRLYEAASMYPKMYFHNLFTVPYIDLEKPWWDPNCVEAMTINGILQSCATSINVNDKDSTAALLFSKNAQIDYGLEDFYESVREGTWTYDSVASNAAKVNADLDGDGVMSNTDFWGFLGMNDVMSAFWYGAGVRMVTRDENNLFSFTYGTESDFDAGTKIVEMMNSDYFINTQERGGDNTLMFKEGFGLFLWARLERIQALRDCEIDYGVLPTPKYTAEQENYANMVSQHTTGLLSIPLSIIGDKLTEDGMVLEALAAESHYTVIPAYIEENLKTKNARDPETGEMIDIIINNRVFDPMLIYNFGSFADTFMAYGKTNNTNPASTLERSKKVIDKTIDKFNENFLKADEAYTGASD